MSEVQAAQCPAANSLHSLHFPATSHLSLDLLRSIVSEVGTEEVPGGGGGGGGGLQAGLQVTQLPLLLSNLDNGKWLKLNI